MKTTATCLPALLLFSVLSVSSAVAQTPEEKIASMEGNLATLEVEKEELIKAHQEKRRLEESLLDLQLAKIRALLRDGKKTEAAAAMKEFKRAKAHFKLANVALNHFPSEITPETSNQTFRGKEYIGVQIGRDLYVYNSLNLDQPARVRHLLNDRLLKLSKEFAEAADGAGTYGLMVSISIPYRSFLDDEQSTRYDALQLYFPLVEIKRFAEYEITSQELVDAAVIIVNDNRVAVNLR